MNTYRPSMHSRENSSRTYGLPFSIILISSLVFLLILLEPLCTYSEFHASDGILLGRINHFEEAEIVNAPERRIDVLSSNGRIRVCPNPTSSKCSFGRPRNPRALDGMIVASPAQRDLEKILCILLVSSLQVLGEFRCWLIIQDLS